MVSNGFTAVAVKYLLHFSNCVFLNGLGESSIFSVCSCRYLIHEIGEQRAARGFRGNFSSSSSTRVALEKHKEYFSFNTEISNAAYCHCAIYQWPRFSPSINLDLICILFKKNVFGYEVEMYSLCSALLFNEKFLNRTVTVGKE